MGDRMAVCILKCITFPAPLEGKGHLVCDLSECGR